MAEEWEWIGWLGISAHPDSPSGGPGSGFFRPAGPRPPSTGGLPDPHSPVGRAVSGSDVERMLNQHRAQAAISRAHRATDVHSLRFAANAMLGHHSFGAGVSYGLVRARQRPSPISWSSAASSCSPTSMTESTAASAGASPLAPRCLRTRGVRLMLATGLMEEHHRTRPPGARGDPRRARAHHFKPA
jgi:hypothetical protein